MMEVSPRGANTAGSGAEARRRLDWMLSGRHMRMAAAILMLGGGLSISNGALAQGDAKAGASCPEKCAAEKEECFLAQSSEEYCAYEFKACTKACK